MKNLNDIFRTEIDDGYLKINSNNCYRDCSLKLNVDFNKGVFVELKPLDIQDTMFIVLSFEI